MKSFKLHIYKIIIEAIDTIGSRQRLKRAITLPLYRNALYLMLDTAVTFLIGFFFWMAVARFYSETEVGFGSAIISAIRLLSFLSLIGLNFSIIRFLPQANRPRELINSAFTLGTTISLVMAAVFIAGLGFWAPRLSFITRDVIFAVMFLAMAALFTLSSLVNAVFIARRRAGLVLCKSAIVLLKIPLLVVFATFLHTFGVVASWGIALGVALVISLFLFLPRVEDGYKPMPTLNLNHIKGIRQYAVSSYLASLLSYVPVVILPLMVLNLLGTQSNAYFYIGWMIGTSLLAIPRSVSQSLFAEGSHSEENIRENVGRSIKITFLLLVPAVMVLIVIAKWVLLAFGPSYSNALQLVWLLSLSNLPGGINLVYIGLLRAQGKLKELVVIRGFIAVAVLTLSLFIMPISGIVGIGYAWLGVQAVVAIASAFRLRTWASRFSRSGGHDLEDVNHF